MVNSRNRSLNSAELCKAMDMRRDGSSWNTIANDLDMSVKTLRRQIDPGYLSRTTAYENGRQRIRPPGGVAPIESSRHRYASVERWAARDRPVPVQAQVDVRQVLEWKARGQTNLQIATRLRVRYRVIDQVIEEAMA